MTEIDSTWLACAIDGEGGIGLYHPEHWPTVEIYVVNSDKNFVSKAHKLLGGYLYISDRRERKGLYNHKKLIYKAGLKGHRQVLAVLKQILPYLIVKREKAEEVIGFIEQRKWGATSLEAQKRLSEASRRRWQNPELRQTMSKNISRAIKLWWERKKFLSPVGPAL